jgi:hypothetical protein
MRKNMSEEMTDMKFRVWVRLIANCIIWITVVGGVLSRTGLMSINSTTMGICLGFSILAIVYLATRRNTFLPFLGRTIVPPTILKDPTHPPSADIEVDIRAPPGATHIAYWAANPPVKHNETERPYPHPIQAYAKYGNSGIAKVKPNGIATLRIKCPGKYWVRGKKLPKHVHWRAMFQSGILGRVNKADVICS